MLFKADYEDYKCIKGNLNEFVNNDYFKFRMEELKINNENTINNEKEMK